MPNLDELIEAFELVKKFHDENVSVDVDGILAGKAPDMVSGLMGQTQLSVLGWMIGADSDNREHRLNAENFEETLKRLRSRYAASGEGNNEPGKH